MWATISNLITKIGCLLFGCAIATTPIIATAPEVKLGADIIRDWNSNTQITNGMATTEFHGKWINYLASDDKFKPINTSFVETETGFEMTEAPFEFYAPLYSNGTATFHNNNRYDNGDKVKITEDPIDMTIKANDVSVVEGHIETGDLYMATGYQKNVNYVVYENAYPEGDLIYYVHQGRTTRLEKLVRIKSNPTKLTYSFDLGFSDKVKISKELNGVTSVWNEEENLAIPKNGKVKNEKENSKKGIRFGKFQLWDNATSTSDEFTRNIVSVDAEMVSKGSNTYTLTKTLPTSFFTSPTYPVYTDADFYPGDYTDPTTDGYVTGPEQADWANARDATSGSSAAENSTNEQGILSRWDGAYLNRRMFAGFDTSSIGTNEISSATMSLYVTAITNTDNDGSDYVVVTNTSPANANALVVADYDTVRGTDGNFPLGATVAMQEQSDQIDLGTMAGALNQYYVFTLNATGLTRIIKDGVTQLGYAEGHDASNHPLASGTANRVTVNFVEAAGSGDPKLTVNYLVPVVEDDNYLIIFE